MELPPDHSESELVKTSHLTAVKMRDPLLPLDHFSSYSKLTRVTAWVMRFSNNCHIPRGNPCKLLGSPHLFLSRRLSVLRNYWLSYSQTDCFGKEIGSLKVKDTIPSNSPLASLHPFLDLNGMLQVSRREQKVKTSILSYASDHSVRQTSTPHLIRASQALASWAYSPFFFPQLQVSHSWRVQVHTFHHS